MSSETIVVKVGGRTLSAAGVLEHLAEDIGSIRKAGRINVVLVHGGGAEVTRLAERLGIRSEFADGIRMTGDEEMDVVDMVLAGLVNKRVARSLQAAGVRAVGICGSDAGMLIGEPVERPDGTPSRTGRILRSDRELLDCLLTQGCVAVVASTIMDTHGTGLNVNADDVALELAKVVSARALVFLSDVPGVLRGTEVKGEEPHENEENATIPEPGGPSGGTPGGIIGRMTPTEAEEAIARGIIREGMIPKVRSSVGALHAGVGTVIIGAYTKGTSLQHMLAGDGGTRIES
ncbi:MAG: acetylglutamate kinase [Spirochaetaceae bacterium]